MINYAILKNKVKTAVLSYQKPFDPFHLVRQAEIELESRRPMAVPVCQHICRELCVFAIV